MYINEFTEGKARLADKELLRSSTSHHSGEVMLTNEHSVAVKLVFLVKYILLLSKIKGRSWEGGEKLF